MAARLPVRLERVPTAELVVLCETVVLEASHIQRIPLTLDLVRKEVSELTHDELADLCVTACGVSRNILLKCEAVCAHHDKIPAAAMTGILLSEDVMPMCFQHLTLRSRDSLAAAVCRTWATAWREKVRKEVAPHRIQISLQQHSSGRRRSLHLVRIRQNPC